MTAREPSAVEVIAEALGEHGPSMEQANTCYCGASVHDDSDYRQHLSQSVRAAIRAMTPEQQAEVIGGEVERASFDPDGSFYRMALDAEDEKHLLTYGGTIKARVVSGWRLSEVQP